MEKIIGTLARVVFKNEQNSWTVCEIVVVDEKITVVGCLPDAAQGEKLVLTGEWVTHPEYGRQFSAKFCEVVAPERKDEILRYLSSGTIKGVRAATAEKIVAYFGDDTLSVISDEPEKLATIKGISLKKAQGISESYVQQMGVRDIIMFLQKYGITPRMAMKIHNKYKANAIKTIKSNPYVLCDDVKGIGFETADKIAQSSGIAHNSRNRIKAGILHTLKLAISRGHTCLPDGLLIDHSVSLLDVSEDEVKSALQGLVLQSRVMNKDGYIFLFSYYRAELTVAKKVYEFSVKTYKEVKFLENRNHVKLGKMQKQAVKGALSSGIIVITGGPGTGKTTIIKTIIDIMREHDKTIALAAPTGRAAKRMSEVCGMPAKTIHRLLEISGENDDEYYFVHDETNLLACDMVIVDEASMLDINLASSLFKAIGEKTQVVLVGDSDQLPPVGAGDVLRDIMSSGVVPVVKLTEIFRQEKESQIVVNAHKINRGEYPEFSQKGGDFFLVRKNTAEDILSTIVEIANDKFKGDCQVLAPMRKGVVGVHGLNAELQSVLNPSRHNKCEIKGYGGQVFRIGDKVMQIKNNYSIEWKSESTEEEGSGVFNGDMGVIVHIDIDDELITVKFDDDKLVKYNSSNLQEIELAYATTVHKAQGSEYETIIMPLFPIGPQLATRNLIYTAITRAKRLVVLVGREQVMESMIDNNDTQKRYSQLRRKIQSENE